MLLIIFIVISICKSFVIKFVAVLAFFLTIYIYKLIFHRSQKKNYYVNCGTGEFVVPALFTLGPKPKPRRPIAEDA